jgi:hypothetical protein
MKRLDMVSWDEIYDYWRLYSRYGPSILNQPISPIEIYVDFNKHDGTFYGYDWLTLEEYESRKATIENNIVQFLYFTRSTNKGTIHTLNMLIDSVDDEERAAIWIYSFAKEISDYHNQGNINRYAYELLRASQDFLSRHFYMWHHAMKKLVPEIFISHNVYSGTDFSTINAVIELARLNAAIVLQEYVPILYTSLEPGEEVPDIGLRRG